MRKNKLVIVASNVDMSCNYCVTAKREWVEENYPELLTKYQKFIVNGDDDDAPYGRFGCPFYEYNEENIGIFYMEEDKECNYYVILKE